MTEAGLDHVVDFIAGDALTAIASLDRPVDFVLIDLWKELYIPVIDCVYPKLTSGALVAADNVCLPAIHAPAMQIYINHVRSLAGMQSVTVPVGYGIELSRYKKDGSGA
jgi:predicted O-methyltransferase YrrM